MTLIDIDKSTRNFLLAIKHDQHISSYSKAIKWLIDNFIDLSPEDREILLEWKDKIGVDDIEDVIAYCVNYYNDNNTNQKEYYNPESKETQH